LPVIKEQPKQTENYKLKENNNGDTVFLVYKQ